MAENALKVSATFDYSDSSGMEMSGQINGIEVSIATLRGHKLKQSIGTSSEAIEMGEITTPRWCWFKNLDDTNYIEIYTATSGVIFAKMLPGEAFLIPLGSGITAPYAKANTAACLLEMIILDT